MLAMDPHTTAVDVLDLAFSEVISAVADRAPSDALRRCSRYTDVLAAVATKILADEVQADGDAGPVRSLLKQNRTTSRRQKSQQTRRAKAVATNPDLANKLANGTLSSDQIDVIADAADKSDGAAARDLDLVQRVSSVDPDQGRKIAKDWLAERARADDVNSEHERQRTLRCARRSTSRAGLASITLEGDKASIDTMWRAATSRAHDLYEADGGRSIAAHNHARTAHQRTYDAFSDLVTGCGPRLLGPHHHAALAAARRRSSRFHCTS